jgi:hypothetical protein
VGLPHLAWGVRRAFWDITFEDTGFLYPSTSDRRVKPPPDSLQSGCGALFSTTAHCSTPPRLAAQSLMFFQTLCRAIAQ